MEVGKQLKFKSHKGMQVEFISNNEDVMTHDYLSSEALALIYVVCAGWGMHIVLSSFIVYYMLFISVLKRPLSNFCFCMGLSH